MYLSRNAVIQCSHGGRLVPNRRQLIKIGNQKVLTRQAVLEGKIVKCPNNCERVTDLIGGYESEAPNAPLLLNLEFLTDSQPPGRGVVMAEPAPAKGSSARAILLTSLVWLVIAAAAALAMYKIDEAKYNADYARHTEEVDNLKRRLESFREQAQKCQ